MTTAAPDVPALLSPLIGSLVPDDTGRVIATIVAAVVLVLLGHALGAGIGAAIGGVLRRSPLGPIDRVLGAAAQLVVSALAISVIASLAVSLGVPYVAQPIAGSVVLRAIDAATPAPVDRALAQLRSTVLSSGIPRLGIAHILEGRQLFADQTVEDNLLLGAYARLPRDRTRVAGIMEREMNRFPILRRRRKQFAGNLSGGEQQMLAIARGLMSDPKLILMDEPSMGLAPLVVQEIARIIRRLRQEGATISLVEQMASVALQLAGRVYVFENGGIKLSGTGIELANNPEVKRAYLGG